MHLAAHHNVSPDRLDVLERIYPIPTSRGSVAGRSILSRVAVHVADITHDREYTLPIGTTIGYRTALAVPMLHDGAAMGAIVVARDRVAPFSDRHIALLQTFADQAVIAIENVRLFEDMREKSGALIEANAQLSDVLQQQTATADSEGYQPLDLRFASRVRYAGRVGGAAVRCNTGHDLAAGRRALQAGLASLRSFAGRIQFFPDGHREPSRHEPCWRARPFIFRMFWPIRNSAAADI